MSAYRKEQRSGLYGSLKVLDTSAGAMKEIFISWMRYTAKGQEHTINGYAGIEAPLTIILG